MSNPTDPNDPAFKNNPKYVFSGGRWQAVSNPTTANQLAESPHVQADSLGTPGGMGQVLEGLYNRARGMPFLGAGGPPGGDGRGGTVIQTGVPNAKHWQEIARAGATRQSAANPYDASVADQSRTGQLDLMQQMRATAAGPSLAGMQGQQAMSQNGQNALTAAANGNGRAAMLGAGGAGGGMAGDIGSARLAESMRSSAGIGGAAGNLRGADLRSSGIQQGFGNQAQQLADQQSRFYTQMGSNLSNVEDRSKLEGYKLTQRIGQKGAAANADALDSYMKMLGTLTSMGG